MRQLVSYHEAIWFLVTLFNRHENGTILSSLRVIVAETLSICANLPFEVLELGLPSKILQKVCIHLSKSLQPVIPLDCALTELSTIDSDLIIRDSHDNSWKTAIMGTQIIFMDQDANSALKTMQASDELLFIIPSSKLSGSNVKLELEVFHKRLSIFISQKKVPTRTCCDWHVDCLIGKKGIEFSATDRKYDPRKPILVRVICEAEEEGSTKWGASINSLNGSKIIGSTSSGLQIVGNCKPIIIFDDRPQLLKRDAEASSLGSSVDPTANADIRSLSVVSIKSTASVPIIDIESGHPVTQYMSLQSAERGKIEYLPVSFRLRTPSHPVSPDYKKLFSEINFFASVYVNLSCHAVGVIGGSFSVLVSVSAPSSKIINQYQSSVVHVGHSSNPILSHVFANMPIISPRHPSHPDFKSGMIKYMRVKVPIILHGSTVVVTVSHSVDDNSRMKLRCCDKLSIEVNIITPMSAFSIERNLVVCGAIPRGGARAVFSCGIPTNSLSCTVICRLRKAIATSTVIHSSRERTGKVTSNPPLRINPVKQYENYVLNIDGFVDGARESSNITLLGRVSLWRETDAGQSKIQSAIRTNHQPSEDWHSTEDHVIVFQRAVRNGTVVKHDDSDTLIAESRLTLEVESNDRDIEYSICIYFARSNDDNKACETDSRYYSRQGERRKAFFTKFIIDSSPLVNRIISMKMSPRSELNRWHAVKLFSNEIANLTSESTTNRRLETRKTEISSATRPGSAPSVTGARTGRSAARPQSSNQRRSAALNSPANIQIKFPIKSDRKKRREMSHSLLTLDDSYSAASISTMSSFWSSGFNTEEPVYDYSAIPSTVQTINTSKTVTIGETVNATKCSNIQEAVATKHRSESFRSKRRIAAIKKADKDFLSVKPSEKIVLQEIDGLIRQQMFFINHLETNGNELASSAGNGIHQTAGNWKTFMTSIIVDRMLSSMTFSRRLLCENIATNDDISQVAFAIKTHLFSSSLEPTYEPNHMSSIHNSPNRSLIETVVHVPTPPKSQFKSPRQRTTSRTSAHRQIA